MYGILKRIPEYADSGYDECRWQRRIFRVIANGSVVKKSILWNQEQKEHVFDAIIRRKLLKRGQEELPQLLAAAVGPALNMDHEEVQGESILFLAYAIVRNETCREAIMEYVEKEGENMLRCI